MRLRLRLLILCVLSLAPVAVFGQGANEASARRLLAQARALIAGGDLDAAARELRLVRDQFPNTASAPEALLAEAEVHLQRGDRTAARRVAKELADGWGRSLSAAGALVLLAELDLADTGDRAGLERLQTEVARIPLLFGPEVASSLPARTRALALAGTLGLRLGDVDRGVGQLLAAAEDEPSSSATPPARLALARALAAGGRWTTAAWWAQRALDSEATRNGARDLLASIERLEVRPSGGTPPWRGARRLPTVGLEAGRGLRLAASPLGPVLVADDRNGARELGPDGAVAASVNAVDTQAAVFGLDGRGWIVLPDGLLALDGRRLPAPNPDEPAKSLDRVADAAPDPFGGWFLLDGRRDRVVRIDGVGRAKGVVGGLASRPIALASDALGRLHVLDRKAGTVSRVDASGGVTVVVRGSWKDPLDLAIGPAGHIAVLDEDGPKIQLYRADGSMVATLGATLPGTGGSLGKPVSIALDAAGRLLIADRKAATTWVIE